MELGTPERFSLHETQTQVNAIEGKTDAIEVKVDNLGVEFKKLSTSLRTIDASLAKLLAADEERHKEKEPIGS